MFWEYVNNRVHNIGHRKCAQTMTCAMDPLTKNAAFVEVEESEKKRKTKETVLMPSMLLVYHNLTKTRKGMKFATLKCLKDMST